MAKIAVELRDAVRERVRNGSAGSATARELASGPGWRVADVLCTSEPDDRPFEERHFAVSVAIVIAGTFQYRTGRRRELMVPGSILLGHPAQPFECAHEHGTGDRCISFRYDPEYFATITGAAAPFAVHRIPPLRAMAPLAARACAALEGRAEVSWEELAIAVAARAAELVNDVRIEDQPAPANAVARTTRAVRIIERHAGADLALHRLATDAGLSPYHFLRTFTRLTGVTPHQFALRTRLREAALRLSTEKSRVIDVALDSGFGDVSNFTRTFRAEFGTSPRRYRVAPTR